LKMRQNATDLMIERTQSFAREGGRLKMRQNATDLMIERTQ